MSVKHPKYTSNNKPAYTSYARNEMDKHCCWLLSPDNRRCNKPTNFIMVTEEDGIAHRAYYAFCTIHLPQALIQDNEDKE